MVSSFDELDLSILRVAPSWSCWRSAAQKLAVEAGSKPVPLAQRQGRAEKVDKVSCRSRMSSASWRRWTAIRLSEDA